MADNGKEPILDFMVVRAPERLDERSMRNRYIRDRIVRKPPPPPVTHVPSDPEDPQAPELTSPIVRILHDLVLLERREPVAASFDLLKARLLATLPPYRAQPLGDGSQPGPTPSPAPASSPLATRRLRPEYVAQHAHLEVGEDTYILIDQLEQLAAASVPLIHGLATVRKLLDEVVTQDQDQPWDPVALRAAVASRFSSKPLHELLFDADGHSPDYRAAHRALFDALYTGYLLRRWTSVDLSDLIRGLQTLHALAALAVDSLLEALKDPSASAADIERFKAVVSTYPELSAWDRSSDPPGFPLAPDRAALSELLSAHVVVTPLVSRVFYFLTPFSTVKPIGIGDLKVVKQWLTAYRLGEISRIHPIMKGERRTRRHRRVEKSEEVFSLSTTRSQETTRDTQSTDRFEVKAEVENLVRTSLNVTANASLTYNNSAAMITASAGAGFGYTNATEDHTRTGQNYAHDVVAKAVDRIQTQSSSQRTLTQTFETDELNTQKFDNVGGDKHISGMYRWVDKEYTAQVFNYGRRLMFEVMIPSPAASWVELKIRGYQSALEVPQPPLPKPVRPAVALPFTWAEIDQAKFDSLRASYDLEELPPYPPGDKRATVRDMNTRSRYLKERDIHDWHHAHDFDATIAGGAGYQITAAHITGYAQFHNQQVSNRMEWVINGSQLWEETRDNVYQWPLNLDISPPTPMALDSDDATVTIAFTNEINYYETALEVDLHLLDSTLEDWQRTVYKQVLAAEQKRADDEFAQKQLTYEAALSTYQNRLDQVKAQKIHDIIAGASDFANKMVMDEEIKKHCIALLANEYDTKPDDDPLGTLDAVGTRPVDTLSYELTVTEAQAEGERTTVGYELTTRRVDLPAIDIAIAFQKGSMVQFLEQAFEWERISYLFHPYFWASMPDWVELMNRSDDVDATFAAFLRAGMARVLIAATPGYEDAVMYYLNTGQPWGGGRSPAIGDPLFLPLHDELRGQTDDRSGGEPDGEPWTFRVPTSLVYLHGSADALPDLEAEGGAGPN